MDVPLASDHLVSQPARRIGNGAEQQHSPLEFLAVRAFADIHHDRVHGIRPRALRIAQRGTDLGKRAHLGRRPECAFTIAEPQGFGGGFNSESRIDLHIHILTDARIVAHFDDPPGNGRTMYFPTAAGTINVSA